MSGPALLNSFTNDDRGSASLEFGLVIVPFIFTILFTLFLALFLFIQTALTNIVNIEARHMMTGQMWAQDGPDYFLQELTFHQEASQLLPRGLPKHLLSIQVNSADSLEDLQAPPSWGNYYRPGGPSSYAIIVATYDLPFTKSLASIFHLPSMVSATTLLKLEPYDS